MNIISNIADYFPTIGKYARLVTLVYNQVAPILNAISKAKDCELFLPNSASIKKALEESGDFNTISIINKLSKNQNSINSSILDDPLIIQNQRIAEIIQNINSKFYESMSNNKDLLDIGISNEILNDSISIGDPCVILNEDLSDALKRNQQLHSDFIKTLNKDSKAFKVLERCKTDNTLLKSLQNPEIWTSEELQKVIDNCILPEDIDVGLSDDLTGTPEIKNIPNSFNTNDDELPVEGEGLTLDQIFENFKKVADTLDKEDNTLICAEKVFNASKHLQESAISDTKDKQTETYLKLDLEYETLFNANIQGIISGIKNAIDLGIGIGLQPLKLEVLNKYSDEISINNKKINFSVRSARVPIGFSKKRKKNKGARFNIENKYGKILSSKKFESYDEVENILKKKDNEILQLFNSYKRNIFNDGYETGKSYGNKFDSNQNNKILKTLNITKEDSDKRLNIIETKLKKIDNDIKARAAKTKSILEELDNLKCDSNLRVAKDLPDENLDFSGAPDPSNPTILDGDYWRRFADLASKVGALPIPQFIGSNDFKVQFTGEDAEIKLPYGSIAIDEDAIPRFLFWPIGLPIPVPTPPDFLLRIPMPMLLKYMTKFELKDPLKELEKKLNEKYLEIEPLRDAAFIISQDDPLDAAYSKIPNATLDSIIKLMGVSDTPALTFAFGEISKLNGKIIEIVKSEIFTYIQNNSFEPNQIAANEANNAKVFIQGLIQKIGLRLQKEIQPLISDINKAIVGIQESINFEIGGKNVLDYLNDITEIVQAAESILKIFGVCISENEEFSEINDTIKDASGTARSIRDSTNYLVNTPLDIGDIIMPFLILDEYLEVSDTIKDFLKPITDEVEKYIKELKKDFKDEFNDLKDTASEYKKEIKDKIEEVKKDFKDSAIYEMFPKLKFLSDILTGKLIKRFYNILRAGLANAGFDFRSLMNLPDLGKYLTNIPLVQLNFPHLLFVFFIGFNPLPYPFLLCVNLSNAAVPGLIEPNAIKFIVTADFTNPIKMIKRNWGSHTVPIKTQIEGLINSSMGLGFSNKNGVVPNICAKLGDIKSLRLDNIIEQLIKPTKLYLQHLKNAGEKNLYKMINWPNPNLICQMLDAQKRKESYKKALNNYAKLKNSILPPSVSKKEEGISNGLPDLKNGKLKIDELKTTFGVNEFPNLADIIPMDQSMQSNLTFADMGITADAIFDLLPELTNAAPYIQDDLPAWERLHLKNIPFLFFLAEFLVAAKKGARFPIPEVNPLLEMK